MLRCLNNVFGQQPMFETVEKRQRQESILGELQSFNDTDFGFDRQESTVLQPVLHLDRNALDTYMALRTFWPRVHPAANNRWPVANQRSVASPPSWSTETHPRNPHVGVGTHAHSLDRARIRTNCHAFVVKGESLARCSKVKTEVSCNTSSDRR